MMKKFMRNMMKYDKSLLKLKFEATDKNSKNHLLILPYKGEKGTHIINSMKRTISKILPENIKIRTTYTGKRLNTCFKTKDKTKFEHQHEMFT